MKFLKWGRIKKSLMAGIISSAMIITSATPVLAANEQITFHQWSIDTLLQGDNYGIYSMDWYDDMQQTISVSELEALGKAVNEKLKAIEGVTVKPDFKAEAYEKNSSRESVLKTLFEQVAALNFPKDLGATNMLDFMKEKGILKGDQKGFKLDEACTREAAAVFAVRLIDAVYDELDAGSKGFLWQIKSGDNTAYLLGSIHIASPSIYPFSESLLSAYEASDTLVVEVDVFDEEGMSDFMSYATYQDGTKLKDHLPDDLYKETIEVAGELGLTETDISYYKPWYVSNYFTTMLSSASVDQEADQAVTLGIDNYFMTNAHIYGKPIEELEGYGYQAKMFDDFSDELEQTLLKQGVDAWLHPEEEAKTEDVSTVQAWLDCWRKGDIEGFKQKYNLDDLAIDNSQVKQEYTNALLTNRDKNMADHIEEMLKTPGEHTYFVVVGSAHYTNENSVIKQLEAKGYKATQVK